MSSLILLSRYLNDGNIKDPLFTFLFINIGLIISPKLCD